MHSRLLNALRNIQLLAFVSDVIGQALDAPLQEELDALLLWLIGH